ncbi:MAG: putative peptidoglycan glycosyltransferase FtsW [Bifidobacterium sp.]|uniref:Probable peptidoglycan glycosyltransferase FtsW n=1 Tax=Bifidobacterium fermentum TaxID=3059035 RepID=A0AB39UKV6_9BIFI
MPRITRSGRKSVKGTGASASDLRSTDGNAHDRYRRLGDADDASESVNRVDYSGWRNIFNPVWCYNGFVTCVVALTVFGFIMVFSSSSVSMVAAGKSPWAQAANQTIYGIFGLIVTAVAAHIKAEWYRRASFFLLLGAMFLQLLTLTPLGRNVNGNTGWIGIGSLTLQPAEALKLALCIWLPLALSVAGRRAKTVGLLQAYWIPIVMFAASVGFVLIGKDLGTAMILIIIGFVAFLVGGFSMWLLFSMSALAAVGIVFVFVFGSTNRMNRILAAYLPCNAESSQGVCYQSIHSMYAMASGGLTGVGLGNSREKWNYLPEAHNDFIFAVIGEELGFIGTSLVVLTFIIMGWCLMRVALQSHDSFTRLVLVCIATWIVSQGLINICVVLGLLPVMGLPLPFVSAGGTALIMCLCASGVAMSMMKSLPEISSAQSKP